MLKLLKMSERKNVVLTEAAKNLAKVVAISTGDKFIIALLTRLVVEEARRLNIPVPPELETEFPPEMKKK